MSRPCSAIRLLAVSLAAFGASTAAARADSMTPDWGAIAGAGTIRIITSYAAGDTRERTVWLAVVDGQGYVRASGTSRWDRPIDENPDVEIEVDGARYELRATRVPEGESYDAVTRAMREKYGFLDRLLGPIRSIGRSPRVLRLDAREVRSGTVP